MSFYRWMMDHGAELLFAASLLIFAISLAGSFVTPGSFANFPSQPGEANDRLLHLLTIVGTFGTAVSHSALTFFGACFLYRLDSAWAGGARK